MGWTTNLNWWSPNFSTINISSGFLKHIRVTLKKAVKFFTPPGALEKMAVAVAFGNHDELQSLVHAAPATAPWGLFQRGFGGPSRLLIYWVVVNHIFFMFTPKIGEDEPIFDDHIFSDGLVQPPTSLWSTATSDRNKQVLDSLMRYLFFVFFCVCEPIGFSMVLMLITHIVVHFSCRPDIAVCVF